jgi:hypothetical protein
MHGFEHALRARRKAGNHKDGGGRESQSLDVRHE